MPKMTVKVDVEGAQEWFDALEDKVANKVARYWIIDVGRRAFSAVKDAMAAGYTMKRSYIDLNMKTQPSEIAVIISGKARQTSLSRFNVGETATGVLAEVRRSQNAQYYVRAFLKTVPTPKTGRPYKGVFISVPDSTYERKSGRSTGGRWRLKALYWSTSFGLLLKSEWIHKVVNETIAECKDRIFKQKINDIGLK